MSYSEDLRRGVGLLAWLLLWIIGGTAGVLATVVLSPIAALGVAARRLDLPPEGTSCPLRGESHDWEPTHGIDERRCTDCGTTRISRM